MRRHVLVVDDDPRLRDLLHRFLSREGYHISVATDAAEAREALGRFAFDLMILDVMMPGESGIALATELARAGGGHAPVPILMLTARGEVEDRIIGLRAGVDDYLVKPFEPRELALRIEAILRRSGGGQDNQSTAPLVRFGPFIFDLDRRELSRDGEPVYLTAVETSLLHILAARPGEAVPRHELIALSGVSGSDRAVDTQMARLRRKIELDAKRPRFLLTMRGEGYALRTGI